MLSHVIMYCRSPAQASCDCLCYHPNSRSSTHSLVQTSLDKGRTIQQAPHKLLIKADVYQVYSKRWRKVGSHNHAIPVFCLVHVTGHFVPRVAILKTFFKSTFSDFSALSYRVRLRPGLDTFPPSTRQPQ